MANVTIQNILGDSNNACMMMEAFKSSPSIILTDNPEFTKNDFINTFPSFFDCPIVIPDEVMNLFIAMANKSIKYDRYKTMWKYLMCLYIAHFLTLYLKTQEGNPGARNALKNSVPIGIASSKSVDGLSISYDFMGVAEDFRGYGTWKLTIYGQQLVTLTKPYGRVGMWVNG